jgi:serine/threonine protein kinase
MEPQRQRSELLVRDLAVQTLLAGKFTALHPLVPGKNAKVFRARNSLLGREVFLKLYPISETDTGSALREPQLLTELEHENLAKIYSAERLDDGSMLLEMELITGGSFQELIDRSIAAAQWPSIHECIHLISDVAAGLSHLAKRGFVHRDVKPANLVMRVNGTKRQGVVTDLGLVSTIAEGGRAFASRHARIYRPPEVWAGKGYSQASDVYQLAIVLFQLLGGGLGSTL